MTDYVTKKVDEILGDTEGRFVLIGTPEDARTGRAFVFDTAEHCWLKFSSDDEDDGATLNAKLVRH